MKSKILKICILFLFVAAIANVAAAYNIGNDAWHINNKTVQVYSGLLPADWRTATGQAMASWNNAGADIQLANATLLGTKHVTLRKTITSSELPNNVLGQEFGQAGKYNSTTKKYEKTDSSILLNTHHSWSTASSTPSGKYDVESVVVHELGHSLCIGHDGMDNGNATVTMFKDTKSGTTYKRSLENDDKNAIKAIYGRR
jgi:Matrixin.